MNPNGQGFSQLFEYPTGILVVIIAVGGLWGFINLVATLLSLARKAMQQSQASGDGHASPGSASAVVSPVAAQEGPSEDDIVVIAAAVASILGARHRVVSVRTAASSWGQQGRRDIHASHRIR